jgi:hypothetical protein
MREVELPDGKIAEFDDNTPDEVLHSFARDYIDNNLSQPKAKEPDFADKINNNPKVKALAGVYDFTAGLPQGLGNKFVGAVQTATNALGGENTDFAKNLANEVGNLKERQGRLSAPERAGIVGGEIYGDIALTKGRGLASSGAISGLTTPLDESSNIARIKETGKDAALAYGIGKGFEYGGKAISSAKEGVKNIYSGIKSRAPEELQSAVQSIKDGSSELYKKMREIGATINPQSAIKAASDVKKAVFEAGKVNPRLHKDTLGLLEDFEKEANIGQMGLEDLEDYRKLFGDVIKRNTDARGIINDDGFFAGRAIDKIDDVIENLKPKDLANFQYSEQDLKEAVKEGFKLKDLEAELLKNIKGNSKAASVVGSSPAYSKEYKSLKNLEEDLTASVKGNSIVAGVINKDANQKLGFWRNKARQNSSEFINDAAEDARSLPNVKKQLADEYSKLKPSNSEFLSKSADDAKNIQNVRKQIADQENLIKEIENNLTIAPEIAAQGQQAKDLLTKGRSEWKRARKFEKISDIVEKANGDPQRIKVLTRSLVNNKKNLYGFTDEEKSALKHIANGNMNEKVLRFLGGFGIGANNKLIPFMAGAGGYAASVPVGAAVVIGIGTAARQAQKFLAKGKLEEALKVIQSSGKPSEVISKIPDRKLQEKILDHLLKGTALTATELNN